MYDAKDHCGETILRVESDYKCTLDLLFSLGTLGMLNEYHLIVSPVFPDSIYENVYKRITIIRKPGEQR